jgi:hypothetical protein
MTADAAAWGMPMNVAIAVAVAPLVGGVLLVATMPWVSVFAWIIAENSLVEWGQFFLLVVATCLFSWIGLHLLRRNNVLGFVYIVVAAGALFVTGEEISWGQGVFHWNPDNRLTSTNFQGETNLHTGVAHGPTVYGFILISAYGMLAPLIAYVVARRRGRALSLFVPPLALIPAFFVPFAYRTIRTIFEPHERIPRYAFDIVRFAEYAELTLYFGVCVIGILTWRLVVRRGHSTHQLA